MTNHAELALATERSFDAATSRESAAFSPEARLLSDQSRLRISNAMQASLLVQDVLQLFVAEGRRIVRRFNLRYQNDKDGHAYSEGRVHPNCVTYHLDLHGTQLGRVTFSRATAFSDDEVALFELMLCLLVYPLRNALMYERALKSATIDPLTGVQNRTGMYQHLEHQVLLSTRHGTPLSFMMIDIDFFKSINDTHGHLVGDHVLTQTAGNICRATRTSDVVFRYGGEEFSVVLNNTPLDGAKRLADRVCNAVRQSVIKHTGHDITVTVSIGVSQWKEEETVSDLLARADRHLYLAKTSGRNRVVTGGEV